MIFDPRWLPLLLAEISNGKKEKNQLKLLLLKFELILSYSE
jgi:hypothetical protein